MKHACDSLSAILLRGETVVIYRAVSTQYIAMAEVEDQKFGIENEIGAKLSGMRKEYDNYGKF